METEVSKWAHGWQVGPPTQGDPQIQKNKVKIIFSAEVFIVQSLVVVFFELNFIFFITVQFICI